MTLIGDDTLENPSRRAFFRDPAALRMSRPPETWRRIDSLSAGSGDVFWNGWADSEGVFVHGDEGAIFHSDGAQWIRHLTQVQAPIHAMWGTARNRLWAVGWMGLIMRYDGETWHKVRGCVVDENGRYASGPENTPLFGIAGHDDGKAWAVGDRGTILHFDGIDWKPETSGARAHLRAIQRLADGTMLAAGGDGCVLLRSDDGAWSRLECGIKSNFTAILALEDGGALLAGGRYFVDGNGFRGDLVLLRDGGFVKLFADETFSRVRDLAAYRDAVIMVGDAGQIHTIGNGTLSRIESGTTHDLLGIVALPNDELIVVGDFGTVLAGNENALSGLHKPSVRTGKAARWTAMESPTDRQLWGAWTDPVTDVTYACGEEGTVMALDRGQWEQLPPAGALGIHDLDRAPDSGLLAAGQLGEIHHFDGSTWRKAFDLHMDVTILSLWSDGGDGIFAAGDEGLVLQRQERDGDWLRMPSGTTSALYGLWGKDAAHLLAVGDFGLVMRWNGKTWDAFNAGTEHFLFDVWGRGLDDIYVVGLSGTIGHFDGQRWTITPARARNDLLAVAGTDTKVVAVGAAGAAMVHEGAHWKAEPTGCDAGLRAVAVTRHGEFCAVGDRGTILRRTGDD